MGTSWKLVGYKNSFASKRTKDSAARRRFPLEQDEDSWLIGSISPYNLDAQQKIMISKASRRMQFKTQVMTRNFSEYLNGHIRSRKAHTEDVVAVATAVASVLGLNRALCRAIAYGHDLGHTPFGHLGEEFLTKITGRNFRHEVFGVVLAQKIERRGNGLNLTHQVLEGILNHSRGKRDMTVNSNISPEASVVMFADKIAYVWSDINDMFNESRAGLTLNDYPKLKERIAWFGERQRDRVRTCEVALCLESAESGRISFDSSETAQRFAEVRKLMYEVYGRVNFTAGHQDDTFYRVYSLCEEMEKREGVDAAILFALLCDHEAIDIAGKWRISSDELVSKVSIAEIVPHLRGREIDFTDPDLSW